MEVVIIILFVVVIITILKVYDLEKSIKSTTDFQIQIAKSFSEQIDLIREQTELKLDLDNIIKEKNVNK